MFLHLFILKHSNVLKMTEKRIVVKPNITLSSLETMVTQLLVLDSILTRSGFGPFNLTIRSPMIPPETPFYCEIMEQHGGVLSEIQNIGLKQCKILVLKPFDLMKIRIVSGFYSFSSVELIFQFEESKNSFSRNRVILRDEYREHFLKYLNYIFGIGLTVAIANIRTNGSGIHKLPFIALVWIFIISTTNYIPFKYIEIDASESKIQLEPFLYDDFHGSEAHSIDDLSGDYEIRECYICNRQNITGCGKEQDIIVATSEINEEELLYSIRTLRSTGCKAKVFLMTHMDYSEALSQCGVNVLRLETHAYKNKIPFVRNKYSFLDNIVDLYGEKIDRILFIDISRTLFQSDPFCNINHNDIYLSMFSPQDAHKFMPQDGTKSVALYNELLKKGLYNPNIFAGEAGKLYILVRLIMLAMLEDGEGIYEDIILFNSIIHGKYIEYNGTDTVNVLPNGFLSAVSSKDSYIGEFPHIRHIEGTSGNISVIQNIFTDLADFEYGC